MEQEAEPLKNWPMHRPEDKDRCHRSRHLFCRRHRRRWHHCRCAQNDALCHRLPCPISLRNRQKTSIPFPYPIVTLLIIIYVCTFLKKWIPAIDKIKLDGWMDRMDCNLVFATMMGGRALEVTWRSSGIRGASGRSDAGFGRIDGWHPAPVFRWPRPWGRRPGWSQRRLIRPDPLYMIICKMSHTHTHKSVISSHNKIVILHSKILFSGFQDISFEAMIMNT